MLQRKARAILVLLWVTVVWQNGTPLPLTVCAEAGARAGLVVAYGDGRVDAHCLDLGAEEISGYDLLVRSGIEATVAFGPSGVAVCGIESVGCPAERCFCQSPPDYWSYWTLSDDGWVYSAAGASQVRVAGGSVQAWSWGPGEPPPPTTLEEICAAGLEHAAPMADVAPTSGERLPAERGAYLAVGIMVVALGSALVALRVRRR